MKRYKLGVIGLGARAEAFARNLYAGSQRAELFGLCDLDEDRMKKFCDYCGIKGTKLFLDPEEFMSQKEMDGVIITTPDFAHCEPALLAIAAKKHFYLEKPMDVTLERCHTIMKAVRGTGVRSYMGFNMRCTAGYQKLKEVVDSGVLGQIVQIEGLEQLHVAHSASFMRRYHRLRKQSGGLLNTKSSHDMDMMQWLIGHQHKLKRVAAFGGTNVFLPKKAPAKRCSECPPEIYRACRYKDAAGFVFSVHAKEPIHHRDTATYGGDMCVYNSEKDIADNMTAIFEWDSGIRGNFNLQLFQYEGARITKIWGENGLLEYRDGKITLIQSPTGHRHEITPKGYAGGHGGSDPMLIGNFIDAIEGKEENSNLSAGLTAAILALKAEEAMVVGKVLEIDPKLYQP